MPLKGDQCVGVTIDVGKPSSFFSMHLPTGGIDVEYEAAVDEVRQLEVAIASPGFFLLLRTIFEHAGGRGEGPRLSSLARSGILHRYIKRNPYFCHS